MPDAREVVLGRIRAALGQPSTTPAAGPDLPPVPRGYRRRGERPPGDPALLDLLAERLADYRAAVHRTDATALPGTLAEVVAATLPAAGRLLVPPGLPAGWAPPDAVTETGAGAGALTAAELDGFAGVLTGCAAAAAETGTIALDGSAGQGRRALTLVPDRHICVVLADQVVQTVPELLARLDPNRPLTLVSGPSATSDIELHRVEGVHGPRTLVAVLVG